MDALPPSCTPGREEQAALWSSVLLLLGSCCGDYAVWCTRKAHEQSPAFSRTLQLAGPPAGARDLTHQPADGAP
jgi:hypothetical protein